MTHPIPGADSENDDTPISMSTYGSKEECEAEHARRAAAKVGANVAADENLALVIARLEQIAGNFSDTPRELAEEALVCARCLAAGAPAETPMGIIPASVDLNAPGEVNEKLLTYLNTADQTAPAETPKPTWDYETFGIPNEEIAEMWRISGHSGTVPFSFASRVEARMVEVLAAQPAPAPIAGDVEKDAQSIADEALDLLDLIYSQYENGDACYENPDEHEGYLGNAFQLDGDTEHKILHLLNAHRPKHAEIDAAMLANSSSGEAG